jgi:predicted  nucleic acid-binding Zn-ribbon protein
MKPNIGMVIFSLIFIIVVLCITIAIEKRKVSNTQSKIKIYEDSIFVYKKELQTLKLQKDSLDISLAQSLEELEDKKTQIKTLKKKLYAKADSVKLLPNDKSVEYLSKFLSKRSKAGE